MLTRGHDSGVCEKLKEAHMPGLTILLIPPLPMSEQVSGHTHRATDRRTHAHARAHVHTDTTTCVGTVTQERSRELPLQLSEIRSAIA